jgi:GT2 family glycosyltransferase
LSSKIAIVILNYINYEDTIACVNCALRQTYTNFEIVIIENGSPNKSHQILSFIYGGYPRITILYSRKNLGFARGNNLGIKYARTKLKADYVFVCNSDITFQKDLFDRIVQVDCKGIGVISPTVYQPSGNIQPPSIITDNIYKKAFTTAMLILINWMNSPILSRLYHSIKKKKRSIQKKPIKEERSNGKYVLQGCAYFLTPEFFHYYNQLYPKTFLYWEEINLLIYLHKVKLASILLETSPVIHKGAGSARLVYHYQLDRKKLEHSTLSMLKSLPMFFQNYNTIRRRYH